MNSPTNNDTAPGGTTDPGTAPGSGDASSSDSASFAGAVNISKIALYVGAPDSGGTAIGNEPYLIKEGDQLYLHYSFEITADQMDEISPTQNT